MNVLMLGNGFDLHYYLPTKYNNFLHTVEYLAGLNLVFPSTAGDAFSDVRLTKKDSFIAKCYEVNKSAFDGVTLNHERIFKLTELARNNMWFKYLLSSCDEDVGWIDFEKEIKKVLDIIRVLFDEKYVRNSFPIDPRSPLCHIIKYFGFFVKDLGNNIYVYNDKFLIENPVGSGNRILDINKVARLLFDELCVLSEMLKLYLSEFIEKTIANVASIEFGEDSKKYEAQYVISFNYTKMYEHLFPNGNVIHIHGTTDAQIVLGVNPDDDDEKESVNTTFLAFKKYYQRVFWGTDYEYLSILKAIAEAAKDGLRIHLHVMGHSLDVTDKDTIKELFEYSTKITISYHNTIALSSYVDNLVTIYGKNEFDELRYKKELTFIKLS